MPGIVGLITKMPRELAEAQLLEMIKDLGHECFYATGKWFDETLGVYVGWSVPKNSFADGMPLSNEEGDVILIFSGEEFPVPGTIRSLKERGHMLEAEGPSYLVHLYEEDPAFPAGLNGLFHGLVADRAKGIVVLFNDRYGMHRVYYHEAKDTFYFAAEAKAILGVRPELRRLDPRGLGEFVACGCVLENRSIFEGVYLLPPASGWVFRNGLLEGKRNYFCPREWEEQETLGPENYYQELRAVFSHNLLRYFNGHERIGMSLTGGLDTRMVMAWQKLPPGSLSCYTYGGMFRESRDVQVAGQVASACGQPHHVITVGYEFLSRFSHYAERSVYLSEACNDLLRSPDLYVSEIAREVAPVRMTGLYGDEVLRHARAFKPVRLAAGLFCPELLESVREAQATYSWLLREHPLSFAVFRQAPWYHYGILALEQSQLTVRTPFLDNDFVRTVFRAPPSAVATNDVRLRLIGDGNPGLLKIPTDLGFGGEARHFLAEASRWLLKFTYKAEYAYDYGMPQWVARTDHFLAPFRLERLFLGRHKVYHFRVWYRDALSRYVREMLLDPRTLSRPFLVRNTVEAIVRGHLNGDKNFTMEIHKLLTLELLHRLFVDSR